MLRQRNPGLRRNNVVLDSLHSCVSNASEKFSWTPEVSFSKVTPQPRMFMQKFKGRVTLKQLESFANRHCWGQFNKEMDMVNSDMKLVDFTSMLQSDFANKPFTINFDSIKLEWVHSIFRFPYEMEGILPEGMFKTLQIHFLTPSKLTRNRALTNFDKFISRGSTSEPHSINKPIELNIEDGNSSLGLKAEVPLPLM